MILQGKTCFPHPVTRDEAREEVADALEFGEASLQKVFSEFLADENDRGFILSTARPRIVDGSRRKSRYLRPDVEDGQAILSCAWHTVMPESAAWPSGVRTGRCRLAGRRNNPPDAKAGIRALAVYSPIHYEELPELFMDFVSSLTGKSPSTAGAGSEGALAGPFNALLPVVDLNYALVSYMLTGDDCFTLQPVTLAEVPG